jgi:hypothetical protein
VSQLLEQFGPWIGNEAVAVWHLHARKRLGIEHHRFVATGCNDLLDHLVGAGE